MEWSAEQIERLRTLWDEGHSAAEIGRRMGLSKNSIVGKAHRLDLPARQSPIRPNPDSNWREKAAQARRAGRDTLPLLACLRGATQAPAPRKAYTPRIMHPKAPIERPTAAKGVLSGPRIPCCWPFGDPKDKEFRFCGKPSRPGKPYCEAHCEDAYVIVEYRDKAA